MDETVQRLQEVVLREAQAANRITFYKQNQEYYFPLVDVLFFETEGEHIYAHTADDAYRIKHRLYELEALLPEDFVRASKSTIVNVRRIYSIARNITASSLVKFTGSHKQVYVSRYYYAGLRKRLTPRREPHAVRLTSRSRL